MELSATLAVASKRATDPSRIFAVEREHGRLALRVKREQGSPALPRWPTLTN